MRRILYVVSMLAVLTVTASALPPLHTAPGDVFGSGNGRLSPLSTQDYLLHQTDDPVASTDLGDWGFDIADLRPTGSFGAIVAGLTPTSDDAGTLRNNTRGAIGMNGNPLQWEWTGDHRRSEPRITPPAETPIPEPATLLIMGLGLFAAGVTRKLRHS